MPLYRLYLEDGTDAGEARYNDWLRPGDEIHVHGTVKAVVIDVVPVVEHDDDRSDADASAPHLNVLWASSK